MYNKFQPATNLLITDYPGVGGAEMRSWCHETVAGDWQKFRSSENYNKLAYHTEFPWMADGKDDEVSMNYATLNDRGQWEVLRLYTFKSFEEGIYRRDAVLETNREVKYQLADIPLPGGVLRIDKVSVPKATTIRLGHYSLPKVGDKAFTIEECRRVPEATIIGNGDYKLATLPLYGWDKTSVSMHTGLHPMSDECSFIMNEKAVSKEHIMVTLHLWKKGTKAFSRKELSPVKDVKVADDLSHVEVTLSDGTVKRVEF